MCQITVNGSGIIETSKNAEINFHSPVPVEPSQKNIYLNRNVFSIVFKPLHSDSYHRFSRYLY